ncbi:MAG: hypothetical protein WDN46_10465 [Methylocella sp.]
MPVNGNTSTLDLILSGTFIQALTNVPVTLTLAQVNNMQIAFTGALTANVPVTFPAIGGIWIINNQTTGDFDITLESATAGGATIVVPTGISQVFSDGKNLIFVSNPAFDDVGKVYEYSGLRLPAGHLWANGGQASRTSFANLFNATTEVATVNMNGTGLPPWGDPV